MSEAYADILKRQWKDVPKVKLLPTGTYELKLRNASFQKARDEDKNPNFMFVYEPVSAQDDVDEGQLAELGAEYDMANNRIFFKLWYETSADLDALRAHLAKHGVDNDEQSIEDSLKAAKNTKVIAYLDQRSYTNRSGDAVVTNDPKNFVAIGG